VTAVTETPAWIAPFEADVDRAEDMDAALASPTGGLEILHFPARTS
jgi:hypothetical protein